MCMEEYSAQTAVRGPCTVGHPMRLQALIRHKDYFEQDTIEQVHDVGCGMKVVVWVQRPSPRC